jgi:hypothetical protein
VLNSFQRPIFSQIGLFIFLFIHLPAAILA